MSRLRVALGLALALTAPAGRPRAADAESELLRTLSIEHPDDVDLRIALARALEREGELADAEDELAALARAGEPRTGVLADLGRVRLLRGRFRLACEALERAVEAAPGDAQALIYQALALRALGRLEESDRALERAHGLSPELEPESTVLRALNHHARGAQGEGDALLRQVIERAPQSSSARDAQALLGGRPPAPSAHPSRLELSAWSGVELDSNVTLEGDGFSGLPDRSDERLSFGASLATRVVERERTHLSLGYRYAESAHRELEEFDLRSHLLFASGAFDTGERTRLRLDALASDEQLADHPYLRTWTLRPNLFRQLGPRAGIARLFGELERAHYQEDPLLAPLDQTGDTYALGLEHFLSLPRIESSLLSVGVRAECTDTGASSLAVSSAGGVPRTFSGDFDRRGAETTARLRFPLPARVEAELTGSYGLARYLHRNLVDWLLEGSAADRRRDRIYGLGVALERHLSRHLSLRLHWSYLDQRSNVDPYSYDRHVGGVLLKASTF